MPITINNIIHNVRALNVYLGYRLVLSCIFFVMHQAGVIDGFLGKADPKLFQWAIIIYSLFCISSIFIFPASKLNHSFKCLLLLLFVDFLAIALMIHASGSLDTRLEYLLIITTALASIFLPGKISYAFASASTIFILYESIIFSLKNEKITFSESLFSAGILGIFLFTSALIFSYLAIMVRSSDALASEKTAQAKRLEELANYIVTRMRTGIIVVDNKNNISLINESAKQLFNLGKNEIKIHDNISSLATLDTLYFQWLEDPNKKLKKNHQLSHGQEIKVSFATIHSGLEKMNVIYLEDYEALAQQAQQLKLASLGRLTANIAHEVRNPLGAISHAAQLLSESQKIAQEDLRLTQIIEHHSKRVNQIIDSTMSLSRRQTAIPEQINLSEMIQSSLGDINQNNSIDITINNLITEVIARIDPAHLLQILCNLCENGARYSEEKTGKRQVTINIGVGEKNHKPYIQVIDEGHGVDEKNVENLFEPFYTTDAQGTGLGLYICQQLCEANQAHLFYKKNIENKSCFTIHLSHHLRVI